MDRRRVQGWQGQAQVQESDMPYDLFVAKRLGKGLARADDDQRPPVDLGPAVSAVQLGAAQQLLQVVQEGMQVLMQSGLLPLQNVHQPLHMPDSAGAAGAAGAPAAPAARSGATPPPGTLCHYAESGDTDCRVWATTSHKGGHNSRSKWVCSYCLELHELQSAETRRAQQR